MLQLCVHYPHGIPRSEAGWDYYITRLDSHSAEDIDSGATPVRSPHADPKRVLLRTARWLGYAVLRRTIKVEPDGAATGQIVPRRRNAERCRKAR